MPTGQDQLLALLAELRFVVVDEETAIGEVEGIPTALPVLGVDPPALMVQFRVNTAEAETQPVVGRLESLLESLPRDQFALSVENGSAWLSLYNVSGLDNASIQQLLERAARVLQSSDLAVEPGCLWCGSIDDAQLMYVEGRATRLCPSCMAGAARQRQELESQVNRGELGATLGLPGAALFAAVA